MTTNQLTNDLLEVAVLRFKLQQAKGTLATAQEQFAASHAGLIAEIQDLEASVYETEKRLKGDTLLHFQTTGTKKPCDGLEVKVFKVLDYNAHDALVWSKRHPDKGLLQLDRKLYDKLLKIARENDLPDWADAPGTVVEEPRVQIAVDLTKMFPIEEIAAAGISLEKPEDLS